MAEHKTLLEFLMDLLTDKDALADFQDDPEAALKAAGLEHVCLEDIQELVPVVLEKVSPEDCAKYEDDCDENKCHDDEWHEKSEHHWEGKHHDDCDEDWGHHGHHDHGHEISQVISHLTYVTNNYSYTDNSTHFHNNIWTDGDVTLNQAGGGGVVVDGDNNAPIVTGDNSFVGDDNLVGDGNVVGDGNQISGDGSTTAFGEGNATSLEGVGTGDGGVISTGSGTVNNSNAFGEGNQVAGANGDNTDASVDNSHQDNSDNSDNSTNDSYNDNSDNSVDNSDQDNSVDTDASTNDSGNVDSSIDVGDVTISDNTVDLALI